MFHDTLQQHIAHTQNYTFWSYLPFLSVAFHFLFAAPSKPYIRYPHTNFEVNSLERFYVYVYTFYMSHTFLCRCFKRSSKVNTFCHRWLWRSPHTSVVCSLQHSWQWRCSVQFLRLLHPFSDLLAPSSVCVSVYVCLCISVCVHKMQSRALGGFDIEVFAMGLLSPYLI